MKLISVEKREAAAIVTLNRAEAQNALDAAMVATLSDVFSRLRDDQAVRVVILTGAGDAFSIGANVGQIQALTSEEAGKLSRAGQALIDSIENLGKPVIAAINGAAYGGGCELALACAWRIASPSASFALPESSFGLPPSLGAATRLPRIVGKARALEMVLTGEPINADEALRIGLANRIVNQPEELLPVCIELAERISRNAPLAIKYALEAVNRGSELHLADGLRLESALFALCFASKDAKEGTEAFLAKRQPMFEGR